VSISSTFIGPVPVAPCEGWISAKGDAHTRYLFGGSWLTRNSPRSLDIAGMEPSGTLTTRVPCRIVVQANTTALPTGSLSLLSTLPAMTPCLGSRTSILVISCPAARAIGRPTA